MAAGLRELVATVQDEHLRALLDAVLGPHTLTWEIYRRAPAAKLYHQAYAHGLLEHSLTVAQGVALLAGTFPGIDRDVAVTGALLHDIGKLEAYAHAAAEEIDLTAAGRLQGEIPLGYYRIRRAIEDLPGFPPDTAQAVLHIILSHHGSLAHGSPVVPSTREAWLVHMIDNLGGKLGSFDRVEKELPPGGTWAPVDLAIRASAYIGPCTAEPACRSASRPPDRAPTVKRREGPPMTRGPASPRALPGPDTLGAGRRRADSAHATRATSRSHRAPRPRAGPGRGCARGRRADPPRHAGRPEGRRHHPDARRRPPGAHLAAQPHALAADRRLVRHPDDERRHRLRGVPDHPAPDQGRLRLRQRRAGPLRRVERCPPGRRLGHPAVPRAPDRRPPRAALRHGHPVRAPVRRHPGRAPPQPARALPRRSHEVQSPRERRPRAPQRHAVPARRL